MNQSTRNKECSKCKRLLPADTIHFNQNKNNKDGLMNICKECRGAKFRIPYTYGVSENERKCVKCGKIYPETNEYFSYNDKEHRRFSTRCKECAAKKQRNNPKRQQTYQKWCLNHPQKVIEKAMKRYELLLSSDYTLTDKEWQEVLKYFNNSCAYCGSSESLTKDHVVPITKGGTTSRNNIIPACLSCNSSKSNQKLEKWFKKQSFFTEEKLKRIMDVIK